MSHRLQPEDPQQRQPRRRPHAAARARAVAAELHQLVGRRRPRGLDQPRGLPAHRVERRPAGLGALRLREDARLPLGHLPEPGRRRTAQIHFGDHKGEKAWQDVPGEHRANLRRIIVTQGDTEPASVEQQRHLGLTAPSHVRPAQPVPDQRRGRPPPLGDGLPAAQLLRPRRPRGGRARCSSARSGDAEQPAHPRRLQREDARLAGVLHVHLLHRPRRQVPARGARRERVRSAGAHDQVHADRGSAPHVRRRERRLARAAAHRAGDERAEDRRPGSRSARPARSTSARSSATSTSTTR